MRLQEAQAARQQTPAQHTRSELLHLVALAINNQANERFKTLYNLEYMLPKELRALRTAGNVLEPVEQALTSLGYKTDGKAGTVMRILLLTQEDLHYAVCYCHYGESIRGAQLRENLQAIAREEDCWWPTSQSSAPGFVLADPRDNVPLEGVRNLNER